MRKFNIDATKYDIRILWTGPKEEHVSADAGVVEGYPLDPPDELPGWFLEDFGVESLKDADRYWTLWTRAKTKVRAKRKAKKAPESVAAAAPSAVDLVAAGAAGAAVIAGAARKPRKSKKAARRRVVARPNQDASPPAAQESSSEETAPTTN